jgi:LCP family protein required for cell wall assembly
MFGSGMYAFNKYYVDNSEDLTEVKVIGIDMEDNGKSDVEDVEEKIVEKTKLEKLIEQSNRINILVFGTDGGRADTIFLVSYDPDNNLADIVSVPRDTYHKVEGFDAPGQNKINAVYGFKNVGGSKGMKYFLSEFLNVPIDNYVKVNYSGVAAIIDVIGGIAINVPFDMNYDDKWANPELHIHFEKGLQTLNGKQAVEYLRWRKNNGEEGRGDLDRITRQQNFVKKVVDKALGLKLPKVVKASLNCIRTDMSAGDIVNLATKASDFKMNNLEIYRILGRVGTDGHGLYINNPEETEKMFESIYLRETIEE